MPHAIISYVDKYLSKFRRPNTRSSLNRSNRPTTKSNPASQKSPQSYANRHGQSFANVTLMQTGARKLMIIN